ncbi:signal peptidase I [Helicobacter anatolicus]|uniref:signal peptidase I n=1 Tax=Helicobacter anatolicus TaxID=2905874 RepID=UPI001E45A3FC|nr:signal peptidase I [Helicobacter anatolicus]MCE3039388.1 signal peptidase I [Helicobacter anatolicus]
MKKFLEALLSFSKTWTGSIIIILLIIFFIAQAFIIPSRSMVGTLYEGDMLFAKKFAYGIPIPRLPWVNIPIFPDLHNNGHLIEGKRPERGDIVVFMPPHKDNVYFVKRNFAIGGDEVLFTQKGLYLHHKEGNEYIKAHYKDEEKIEFAGKIFVLNPYMKEYRGIHYQKDNQTFYLMQMLANSKDQLNFDNHGREKIAMQPIELNGDLVFYKKIPQDEFFMIGDNRDNSEDSRFWDSVPYSRIVGMPWVVVFSLNLRNSQEADVANNPKKFLSIRWERMFKNIKTLEKEMLQ